MKKNMGGIDRFVRITIALVIGALMLMGEITGTLAVVLGLLAIVLIATSMMTFCPLYFPFRISTCKQPSTAEK